MDVRVRLLPQAQAIWPRTASYCHLGGVLPRMWSITTFTGGEMEKELAQSDLLFFKKSDIFKPFFGFFHT